MHRYLRAILLVVIVGGIAAPAQEEESWPRAAHRSYQFSLENVLHLALFSGLGVEIPDSAQRWARLVQRAGLERAPWQNISLNSAPFAEGLPVLTQQPRSHDAATLRWQRSKEIVEPVALAWTVIAYVSWLRQREESCQRAPLSPAIVRLIAIALGDLAAQALQFAENKLKDAQTGLYGHEWASQIAMLHALSAFALSVTDSELYVGEVSGVAARARADALFQNILDQSDPPWPTELRLQALWVEALAWYTLVGSHAREAVQVIHRVGAQLLEGTTSEQLSTQAALLNALLVIHRLTGERRYAERAEQLWGELKKTWERARELSVTELGDFVGAFNAVIRVLRSEEAKGVYARFFSFWGERLQLADSEESLARDDGIIPRMAQAGGPYGRAPVFVTKVAYDTEKKRWRLLDERFSTAGALYAASRLLWLSGSCGEGFSGPPAYGLPQSSWIKLTAITESAQLPATPPTATVQPPLAPPVSSPGPKELAELRLQVEILSRQVAELEKRVSEQAERLQRAEQEIAELRQRPQLVEELQQQVQQTKALWEELKPRVERIEQRITEFPWVWVVLALLVIGAVGWLYLRVRRREFI